MNGGQRTCPLEAPAGRVLQSSALEWADIDFDTRLIHVQRGADVLREWQKHCPVGSAATFPSVGKNGLHVHEDTINAALRFALKEAERALVDLDLSPAKVLPLQKRR